MTIQDDVRNTLILFINALVFCNSKVFVFGGMFLYTSNFDLSEEIELQNQEFCYFFQIALDIESFMDSAHTLLKKSLILHMLSLI